MNTKHLKAKILDLAIRGKLVPQKPSEGNAADLLKKIKEEKNKLIGQKKIKADKNSSFIIKAEDGRHYEQFADGSLIDIEDEIPFEIPENWCWCKISEIANKITDGEHNTPKRVPSFQGFYLLSARNIQNGHLALNDVDYVDELEFNRIFARCNPQKNDILISCSGSVGRCTRIEDENKYVMVRSAAMISAPSVNTKYLMYAIQSPELQNQIQYASKQTAQANLFQGAISNLVISLPPLSEQQRIVSAIEKAFEQIDIIEKNKLNLKTYIKQTKSKVLDLAIHGKLVEQNPDEGNAFELLEKIRNEKAELVKQKKIKEVKKSSFIIKAEDGKHYEQFADGTLKDIEDEIPFEIPENWSWCRFGQVCNFINGFAFESKYFSDTGDTLIIRISDINNGKVILDHCKKSTEIIKDDCFIVEYGDLLIAMSGATTGKNGIYLSQKKAYINQRVGNIKIYDKTVICNEYRNLYIQAMQNVILEVAYGGAQPNISGNDICEMYLPLPPLKEQQRIAKKIEQIFAQLDILEKSLGD